MGKSNQKSKQGFTLVETMITLSVLMVGALAAVAIMYYQKKDQRIVQTKATFNSLVSATQYAAINPKVMLDSRLAQNAMNVDLNPLLKTCINDDPNDCVNGNEQDIRLFQGTGTTKREITGFFDANGKECVDPLAPTCVFTVKARAKVTCPAGQATCARADSFTINYSVEYKKPDNMPPINKVETVVGGARTPAMIPGSAIYAQEYNKVNCSELYPLPPDPAYVLGNEDKQSVIGVSSTGQPICGKDPALEAVKTEVCKMKIQNIWQNGGTVSDPPCGPVTVNKIFKLTQASKTTADCVAAGGTVYDQSGILVSSYSAYPGGQVMINGSALADESAFIAQYGLAASPSLICKKMQDDPTPIEQTWTSASVATLNLSSNYKVGSLEVTAIGGGGGGGSSGLVTGGKGGTAGVLSTNVGGSLINGAKGMSCTVTVGAAGQGVAPNPVVGCDFGTDGSASSVVCGSEQVNASGGVSRKCSSNQDGEPGAPSPLTNGFASAQTNNARGNTASSTAYGAGGGGAGCSGFLSGNHPGGNGINGYVKIKYITESMQNFTIP